MVSVTTFLWKCWIFTVQWIQNSYITNGRWNLKSVLWFRYFVRGKLCLTEIYHYPDVLINVIFTFFLYRIDIAAILMSTEDMLWSVCSSVQEFLNPHEDRDLKIYKIHSHCNSLLSVLSILTSPLKNLYEWVWNKLQFEIKLVLELTWIDLQGE